ncbi:MAG: pseudouridine synthase [Myxococcota bacterium]
MPSERLQKILAQAGLGSRRAVESYIVDGRVKVNGKVVRELGSKADPATDTVEVHGHGILRAQPLAYIAMHKPKHVICSVKDPGGRMTVVDLLDRRRAAGKRQFEGELPRVYPVGRLDFDAEGLVLLTNDGALSERLLHPRYHVPKTYMVKVKGRPEDRQLDRLRRGVFLRNEDGSVGKRRTATAGVQVTRNSPANTWLEITIVEGRNHQVKRMCDAIGHAVLRLIRTDVGGISLDPLPAGGWRFLTNGEVESLRGWGPGPSRVPAPKARRKPAK